MTEARNFRSALLTLLALALGTSFSLWGTPAAGAQLQVKHGTTVIAENSTVDFGSTLIGEDLPVVLTVKNLGSSPVTLGPWSIGYNAFDPGRFHLGDVNVPSPLPAGASGTVEIIYRATGAGTVTNSFRIFEGGSSTWEFAPRATGTEPLGPIPRVEHNGSAVPHNSTFQFGSTHLGTDLVETFRVFNDGDQNLTISTYGFGYSGNPLNSFSVENGNVVNVPPGGNGTFDLRFHADGVETTTWKIRLFVGGVSRYEYWVTGTVDPPPMPDLRIKKGSTTIPSGGTYNAGLIGFNDPLTVTFTALNQGDDPLHISNVDFTGDRLQLVQAPPGSIAPNGGTGTFKLRLKADIEGPHSPLVKVWSDDPDENPYEFFLSWTVDDALGPVLRVQLGGNIITQGELVNFGNTGVDMPLSRTFTAYNDGDQPLTIGAISIGSHANDPAGFDVGFNNVLNVPPGGNAQFRLDFDAAGLGSVTSEIDLFVGGISRREFFVKGTVLPPDYEISISPASRTVEPGQNAFYTVQVNALYGFSGTVGLSISNLPPVTNHDFTPFNVTAGNSSQLKVRTFATTPFVSNHTITVTGSHGGTTRSDTAKITIAPPGDFTLGVAPGLRIVEQGDSTSYTVSITPIEGFSDPVNLSVSGLPAGASGSFSPNPVHPGSTSTLSVSTATTTPTGDHGLNITGSAAGLQRSDGTTLRVNEEGTGERPLITGINPDDITHGRITTVTVSGENLQGASIWIPSDPPDPANPVSRVFPTATLLWISGDGSQMGVEINALNTDIVDFYNLAVSTPAGDDAFPFRVLPLGPQIDVWTPDEAERDSLYVLSLVGNNLQGTHVSASPAGRVRLVNVDTSGPDRINGLLEVQGSAPLGPVQIRVTDSAGRSDTVSIDIVSQGASTRMTKNLTEEKMKEAEDSKGGKKFGASQAKVPQVLFQEFQVRQPEPPPNFVENPKSTGGEGSAPQPISFGIYVSIRIPLVAFHWQQAILFDPNTGDLADLLIQNLNPGASRFIGGFVLSFYLEADLVIYWRFGLSGISFPLFCLGITTGLQIPGFGGYFLEFDFCVGLTGGGNSTGSTSNLNMGGGPCADVVQDGPVTEGQIFGTVTQTDCCDQDIGLSGSGVSFPGLPFGTGFSLNDNVGGTTTPGPNCNGTPCQVSIDEAPACLKHTGTRTYEASASPSGGTYEWQITQGGDKASISGAANQEMVMVKGDNASSQADDVTLKVTYERDGSICTAEKNLSVVKVEGIDFRHLSSQMVEPDDEAINGVPSTTGLPQLGTTSPGSPPGSVGFFNNMELKVIVSPCDPNLACDFNFDRTFSGRIVEWSDGASEPAPASGDCPQGGCPDDGGESDEDKTPGPSSCALYSLDGPGVFQNAICNFPQNNVMHCGNFREWLELNGERIINDVHWTASTWIHCPGPSQPWVRRGGLTYNGIGPGTTNCTWPPPGATLSPGGKK